MERDGSTTSLWQNGMPTYIAMNNSLPTEVMDVAIIGGGITGLATALELQKNGKKCVLIESHTIGFGTTGGTTAHVNTILDTSYYQIEKDFGKENSILVYNAAEDAINLIHHNIKEFDIDCNFEFKNGYLFAKDKKQAADLDKIVIASKAAGVHISYTSDILIDVPFEKAAIIEQQAQFHPARYIYGLAKAFEEAGGILVQHCMLESLEDESPLILNTTLGQLQAKQLVYATHIPSGINLLHFRCAPYRSYVLAVKLKNDTYPDGLIYDMDEPYHYYRTQEIDNQKYLIFGGEDHKTGHDENAHLHFTQLEIYLNKYFDIREVSYRWSSQFYEPSDGLAYIGLLPGHAKDVFVATGYSGNGMTYSHIAAKLLSDLILKGHSVYEKVFNPGRIKPFAGFAAFVSENADVIKEFIAKRISIEKIDSLSELKSGEGRIIKYEGNTYAVHKNENGVLHAIDPVCTHTKCIVQWNNAENSWDCPCHGARYTVDGGILNGPTTRNLDQVEIE